MKEQHNSLGRLYKGRTRQAVHVSMSCLLLMSQRLLFLASSLVGMTQLIIALYFILEVIQCKYCVKGLNIQTEWI
jgi:hypothetical protein